MARYGLRECHALADESVEASTGEVEPAADSGAKQETTPAQQGSPAEEAEALVKQAKKLILAEPEQSVLIYEEALALHDTAEIRYNYAFALERAGKHCSAYKAYLSAVNELTDKQQEKAQKAIKKYAEKCN